MEKISILIPTYNNQETIRNCLESTKWADEILIVDSFSTDQTLDICNEYGARIIQHEYIQSAKQKNWAIPQCANEWVLQLDTDELLEPGMVDEIRVAMNSRHPNVTGYRMPFKHHILGVWVRVCGLYPEYHLRLFRRDQGRFEDKEVHAHVSVPGPVETLRHHILHYGMTSISKQLANVDRYSRYQADELRKRGKRFHWYHLAIRPVAIFAYYYLFKLGFMAGYRGFLLAVMNVTFDFWAHAKLWEIQSFGLVSSPQ